jgi:hypothetical protein
VAGRSGFSGRVGAECVAAADVTGVQDSGRVLLRHRWFVARMKRELQRFDATQTSSTIS